MLGYIISVSILFTVIGYGSALNCYTCSDLDSTKTSCSNSSSWPQTACDSGVNLCYYEADSARLANSMYNYSYDFRSCYDTSGGGPLDGWLPLMNKTTDCLTTRYTIESTKIEVGQACQCICNSNGCNQPEFPCKNYINQAFKTRFHIDQRVMLKRQERLLAIRKAVLKHSHF